MISTIAVGTDGSETANTAIDSALDIAERFGARIVFISAIADTAMRNVPLDLQWAVHPAEVVRETLQRAEEKATERGLQSSSEAHYGDPADVLVELAEKHGADVLVIGNKGMQRRVLGSVPNSVTHKARCSVFVVKTT
jgi:nucleotide-binding universal stress UspA family protein